MSVAAKFAVIAVVMALIAIADEIRGVNAFDEVLAAMAALLLMVVWRR